MSATLRRIHHIIRALNFPPVCIEISWQGEGRGREGGEECQGEIGSGRS